MLDSTREGRVAVTVMRGLPVPVCVGAISLLTILAAYAADNDAGPLSIRRELRAEAAPRADIRVDSNLVLVPVSVTDFRNRLVTGLQAGEFRVFEGKTEQKVLQLSSEDAPLSVGIVFDSSGSMSDKLPNARQAVAEFLHTANPGDEFFLVRFSGKAELAVPFTRSQGEIQNRLVFANSAGKTALLDAICLALHYLRNAANERKALLVISDGGENASRYGKSEIRQMLEESDVWLYALGICPTRFRAFPEEELAGPRLLTEIAEETGGREIPVHQARELPAAAAEIGFELRNRYVLAYRPEDAACDGKYHRVQVRLVGHRFTHLSFRSGYYAPAR